MINNCHLNICSDPIVGNVFALEVYDKDGKFQEVKDMLWERFLELMKTAWSGFRVVEVSYPCECTRQRRELAHSKYYAQATSAEKAKCKRGAMPNITFYSDVFGDSAQQFILPEGNANRIKRFTNNDAERTNYSNELYRLWLAAKYGNRKTFIPDIKNGVQAIQTLADRLKLGIMNNEQ